MFASQSITAHVVRGAIGLSALAAAAALAPSHPLLSLLFVPAGWLALRGCPTCWMVGLIQTISARLGKPRAKTCVDGRCTPGSRA